MLAEEPSTDVVASTGDVAAGVGETQQLSAGDVQNLFPNWEEGMGDGADDEADVDFQPRISDRPEHARTPTFAHDVEDLVSDASDVEVTCFKCGCPECIAPEQAFGARVAAMAAAVDESGKGTKRNKKNILVKRGNFG